MIRISLILEMDGTLLECKIHLFCEFEFNGKTVWNLSTKNAHYFAYSHYPTLTLYYKDESFAVQIFLFSTVYVIPTQLPHVNWTVFMKLDTINDKGRWSFPVCNSGTSSLFSKK